MRIIGFVRRNLPRRNGGIHARETPLGVKRDFLRFAPSAAKAECAREASLPFAIDPRLATRQSSTPEFTGIEVGR